MTRKTYENDEPDDWGETEKVEDRMPALVVVQ